MTEWPPSLELTTDQVNRLIKFVAVHRGRPQREVNNYFASGMPVDDDGKFLDENGKIFDPTQAGRRSNFPIKFKQSIIKYLEEEFTDLEKVYIYKNVLRLSISEDLVYRSMMWMDEKYNPLSQVFGSPDYIRNTATEFVRRSSNENGNFVLFSPISDSLMRLATMEVVCDLDLNKSVPSFITRQYDGNGGVAQRIEGFVIMAMGHVYTFGKVADRSNFRITKLRMIDRAKDDTRKGSRQDYFGLRLGGYNERPNPNAHRVYAYQIKEPERFHLVQDIVGNKKDVDQNIFDELKITEGDGKNILNLIQAPSDAVGNLDTNSVSDG